MDRKKKRILGALLGAFVVLVVLVLACQYKCKVITTNAGNECCPVTGRSVDGINTYTHEGKEYNLCSPDCARTMSEAPERYIQAQEES
jgi:YHS domain-containing protein